MTQYDVIVIGGGAAGMISSIFSGRQGKKTLLCEKMPKIGKKLLVTGAGRCNLLNEKVDPSFYDPDAQELVRSVFEKFGKEKILTFFREIGLEVYAEPDGRIFPVTNQAASVMKVLEMELAKQKVSVETGFAVKTVRFSSGIFEVLAENKKRVEGKAVILCVGGKSYPSLGADGGGYGIAERFSHTVIEPVPCTVPLLVKDPWCHHLQGQKIRASAAAWIQGRKIREAAGEVLFAQYGLSGTAILDISNPISIAMNREKIHDVSVELDLIPFMSEAGLEKELARRVSRGISAENLLEGLLPAKLCLAMKDLLKKGNMTVVALELKHKRFKVNGTRSWNEAEFTAGGVPTEEVESGTLESKFQKHFYLAGEIINIGGLRGGYNLAWAWASGALAGQSA